LKFSHFLFLHYLDVSTSLDSAGAFSFAGDAPVALSRSIGVPAIAQSTFVATARPSAYAREVMVEAVMASTSPPSFFTESFFSAGFHP
jgi:hypothetical protein